MRRSETDTQTANGASAQRPTAAVCRPNAGIWALAGLLLLVGIGFVVAIRLDPEQPTDGPLWPAYVLAAACGVPGLLLAAWAVRARVVADSSGLLWRGLGCVRHARWADVTDYYDRLLPQSRHSSGQRTCMETLSGKIELSRDVWRGLGALRDVVPVYATAARSAEWGTLGMREVDRWPVEFGYETFVNRYGLVLGNVALAVWSAWWIAAACRKGHEFADELGVLWAAAFVATALLAMLAFPATMWVFIGAVLRDARRRLRQHIVVGRSELTSIEGERRMVVPWDEVREYRVEPLGSWIQVHARLVVSASHGELDFTTAIRDVRLLKAIIAEFSTNASTKEWRARENESLMPPDQLLTDGPGLGQRCYHYRTRTNRALLWLPTGLALICALAHWLAVKGIAEDRELSDTVAFGGLAGTLALWAWWRYRAAHVCTDALGVTQHTLFGERSLQWHEIREYGLKGADLFRCGMVTDGTTRVWFWEGIAYCDDLKDDIAQRATNAVGSWCR